MGVLLPGGGGGGIYEILCLVSDAGFLLSLNIFYINNMKMDWAKVGPLRHTIGFKHFFFTKSPMGSGLDQNCTCTTRPWGQQHETINRSLRYLVTAEIEEKHCLWTDRQTAGRRTKGYRISSSGLWPVELKRRDPVKWSMLGLCYR